MSSQVFRECWYRYIRLSDEEKKDFRKSLNLKEFIPHDPVEYVITEHREEGWYFWDEIWLDSYGPYNTEKEAREELRKYCVEELGIDIPSSEGVENKY
jgi:hypothetical protein